MPTYRNVRVATAAMPRGFNPRWCATHALIAAGSIVTSRSKQLLQMTGPNVEKLSAASHSDAIIYIRIRERQGKFALYSFRLPACL